MRAAWILAAILLLGLGLRLWGLSFGLPNTICRPDESTLVHRALAIGAGDPNPHFFNYPSLHFYLLTGLYGIYYIVGNFAGPVAFETQFLTDPAPFYLLGRVIGALLGAASVWLLYGIGHRLGGRAAGAVSALFLACSFLHVRDSHFLTVDVPATFWLLASLLFVVRHSEDKEIRHLLLAAAFLGMATSTKYTAGFFLTSVLVASWLGAASSRERLVRLMWVLAITGVVFVAGSPYVLLDFPAFWRDLSFERLHFAHGHDADLGRGWWYHLGFTLPVGLGWPLFLAGLVGFLHWTLRGRDGVRALLVGAVAYFAVAGSGKVVFMRYMLPLLPLFCVAAGLLIAGRGRGRTHMTGLLALILAAPTAWSSYHHSSLLAETDTRVLASRWIEKRVPAGSRIALCCGSDYGYPQLRLAPEALSARAAELRAAGLPAHRLQRTLALGAALPGPGYQLVELRATNAEGFSWVPSDYAVDELVRDGIEWVVLHHLSELEYSRLDSVFVTELERVGEQQILFDPLVADSGGRRYDPIDAFYLPVSGFASVERPGPRIAIYRLGTDRL